MKKVLIGFLSLIFAGQVAVAQPISDNAVIPMAITVNSILRLNVVRGGNIEFVFNTLDEYANGLSGARYSTDVTIASSGNWELEMLASTTEFFDMDGGAGTGIDLGFVCFNLTTTGTNVIGIGLATEYFPNDGASSAVTVYSDLTNTAPAQNILDAGTGNAGGAAENAFTINWECGTGNGTAQAGNTISDAGVTSGRYSTNILLTLIAQ